jgi:hypothetical protein
VSFSFLASAGGAGSVGVRESRSGTDTETKT